MPGSTEQARFAALVIAASLFGSARAQPVSHDFNADGSEDFPVILTGFESTDPVTGAARIWSGAFKAVLDTFVAVDSNTLFGWSVGSAGMAVCGGSATLDGDTYMLEDIIWFDRSVFNDRGPAAQAVFLEIDAQALLIRSRTLQFLSEQEDRRLPPVELAHRVTSDLKIFVGNGGRLTDLFPMTLLRTGMRATWLGPTLHDNPDVCLYLLAVGVSVLNRDTELDAAQRYEFMIDSSVRITLDENGDIQRVTAERPSEPDQIPAVLKYQHQMMREWAMKDLRQLAASCDAVGVEPARELDNALGFTASDLRIASLLAPETTRESDAPRD